MTEEKTTNTTCPYCGVGCGVTAGLDSEQVISITGDDEHPANSGRLCVKGTALGETLGHESRLLYPTLAGRRIDWDQALHTSAHKLRETRERYGPDAIAFYLSGQLLTEDYYVANKLVKGFLGTGNVDTNSRLCMSSAVSAHKRAFGEDLVPCSYADIEQSELLVMVGSNAAWTHPVVYQRIVAAKQANPRKRIVIIDPRRTASCDIADLHLQLLPGSDAFLFSGLLNFLAAENRLDQHFVREHTHGLEETLAAVANIGLDEVSAATGLTAEKLTCFYRWFGETAATVTLFSQGIKQSATGTDKCNAIINCHLATGRIGRPGSGPFSITGQPNAMGGREVGGLSNQLAAHMDFSPADLDRVKRFWGATDMAKTPGLKAVEIFEAVARGDIKFLWIMATNPAVSLPDSARVKAALERCDFVVVSDCTAQTDTAGFADLLLPAAGWGEKDGTVTNSERVISRQRSLVPAAGESRADWWIVAQVAARLGLGEHFPYTGPADIFREHAALSAFENQGRRAFNLGAMARISDREYRDLAPVRWPVTADGDPVELFSDGRYYTPSGRANFVPIIPESPTVSGSMTVNTGRLRDQWHTMTRTGLVPRLSRHRDFFSISVNPVDAAGAGLVEGDLAQVENSLGRVCGLLSVDQGLRSGQSFVPIHWSEQFSTLGKVSRLIPAITDPVSGQPQSKFANAELSSVPVDTWGLLFSNTAVAPPALDYWSRIAVPGGYLTITADGRQPESVLPSLRPALHQGSTDRASYSDGAVGDYREIGLTGGQVDYALFLHPRRDALPGQAWMTGLGQRSSDIEPQLLLAGFSPDLQDCGRMVCSCMEVGEKEIFAAIQAGATTVQQLGAELRCGTQCGSCVPELKQMLASSSSDRAA